MTNEPINLRNYAYLGDAVWELFVREYTVFKTNNAKNLHKITTDRVNAAFQRDMLVMISEYLSEKEADIARRARNLPIPAGRKNIQTIYRQATAFEALIGYWFMHDKERLNYFFNFFKSLEIFS